ncbi:MAG: tetratricopeptide repeat protein [Deltaproteobacteria bacterium]|nr:tetratricopeptide repeat protein [Deltaproteobacteria bacterium]
MRWWSGIALVALSGCAANTSGIASLETQIRAMRTDQERLSRRVEQLDSRLALAEDTVRGAARAAIDLSRRTVRIAPEASSGATTHGMVEDIPSALHSNDDNDEEARPAEEANRPMLRAVGRAPLATQSVTPSANQEPERLPVVPLPSETRQPPAQNPSRIPDGRDPLRGPSSLAPAMEGTLPPLAAHAPLGGTSSVRDPQSTAAYDAAVGDARGGRCAQGADALARFVAQWPDHPNVPSALYWRAECTLSGGDVRGAAAQFAAILERNSSAHIQQSALYKLAQCHTRLGDPERASSFRDRLFREHPTSEFAARLRHEISR